MRKINKNFTEFSIKSPSKNYSGKFVEIWHGFKDEITQWIQTSKSRKSDRKLMKFHEGNFFISVSLFYFFSEIPRRYTRTFMEKFLNGKF